VRVTLVATAPADIAVDALAIPIVTGQDSEVESVKAVSDVFAPMSGEVVEVNGALGDAPESVNDDPYGGGWLVKVRLSDPSERDALMDAKAYTASLG